MFDISTNSTNSPTNIIFTGVAGTGKTYQLLQIAKHYTDYLPVVDKDALIQQLVYNLSWREVVCLILLDLQADQQDLVKVPEILAHEFFISKAAHNERDKNLSNTAWSVLQTHSPIESSTVAYSKRTGQAYFDKDESGAWYLLPASYELLTELSEQLAEFRQARHDNPSITDKSLPSQRFSKQRFNMVSFHQAYGYEEFVEGIRPVINTTGQGSQNGQMRYDIQDGAFLQLCQRATRDPEQRYAMLIDEINRANVSRVFGELLSLIEPDKRRGQAQAMQVNLAYSGRPFSVPANVDIYATMNTQDHSLAPLDMALRRRFRFIDCPPQPEILAIINVFEGTESAQTGSDTTIDLVKLLTGLNNRIIQSLGLDAQLGHAFLFSVQSLAQLQTALIEQIIPQLAQAAGGNVQLLQYLFKDEQQPFNVQFIQDVQGGLHNSQNHNQNQQQIFNGQNAFLGQAMSSGGYVINPNLMTKTAEFAQPAIYQRLY
ncbi:endonuclease [Psychrobacter frigidicola]|uniref:Endonuclease n=1 Tax=Psychrobacter frigidicola TaxID=45611 RepID=A0A5C7A2Z3_9GAMM|nr:AAA family ATPase [Psychrobacter frigidicola]TXD97002.1 endonuclease [Psychrobacter frigidicola]